MTLTQLAKDALVAAAGGYLGTLAMEQFSMKTYKLESEEARKQEENVRPGPPFKIAATKMTKAVGLQLDDEQVEKAGMAMHYLLGPSWLPVYIALRRRTGLHPLAAALSTGSSMSLIVDRASPPRSGSPRPTAPTHWSPTSAHSSPTWCSGSPPPQSWRAVGGCLTTADSPFLHGRRDPATPSSPGVPRSR